MVEDEKTKKEIEEIVNELKQALKVRNEDEKVVKGLEHRLFKLLCPKHYLDECEPAYCVFRITDSCEYIKILRKLNKEIESR
ncbi:hypothetical protein HS1_001041 [Candidatus Desulfofervidus auxilii]|uniref:Uncharacterized protein n=1 Tax=Desulfofervidus auxilii TaxID=1621989 RepID=A0A7U4QK63_DESA2|nr:hypothetical protein [Candidatus Desulfofervidus auxilii]AMM40845.1 hypothetical protein HS1_001041 [Candidatus Desulfofervidus auxilii]CAD7774881.1 hypothetical protein BLFGPEAP_01205 [Candidatus Methanoperedenaceae archaeon GB50]CAD7776382.1 hypothetical protein DMNBHIDG_01280 [Candidatus Methanoperedenaceae archaeon GB37]